MWTVADAQGISSGCSHPPSRRKGTRAWNPSGQCPMPGAEGMVSLGLPFLQFDLQMRPQTECHEVWACLSPIAAEGLSRGIGGFGICVGPRKCM